MVSEGLPVLGWSLTVGQNPQQWRHVRTLYSPLDRQRTESSQEPNARYERDKSATIYSFHPLNISKIKSWGPSIQIKSLWGKTSSQAQQTAIEGFAPLS